MKTPPKDAFTMRETQASMCVWANDTFGVTGSDGRTAVRAFEEWVEFLRSVTMGKPDPVELADTAIVLTRLASRWNMNIDFNKPSTRDRGADFHHVVVFTNDKMAHLVGATMLFREPRAWLRSVFNSLDALAFNLNKDLRQLIDEKMVINRRRQWKVVEGHGYHIEVAA
jgi:hypothetical protein